MTKKSKLSDKKSKKIKTTDEQIDDIKKTYVEIQSYIESLNREIEKLRLNKLKWQESNEMELHKEQKKSSESDKKIAKEI